MFRYPSGPMKGPQKKPRFPSSPASAACFAALALVLLAGTVGSLHPGTALGQQAREIEPPENEGPPVEDSLAFADLLFSRDEFANAAQQYRLFIEENPRSPNIQSAWYRLGECYLKVNQPEDAATSFNHLVSTYKTGPFAGAAAYTLAVMRFNENDYRNALAYFHLAAKELDSGDAQLRARFYHARCLQLTEQPKEALASYEQLMKARPGPEQNPHYERALLESARLHFDLGDTGEALARFQQLAEEAEDREFQEEAIVRGGLLANETGDLELSEELLDRALRFSDTSPWKKLAQVGAIFNAFARENYDKVIGIYNRGAFDAPEDSRAKMLMVVGHAHRKKGDPASAIRLYSLVETKYPGRPEGAEAGYRKLQMLHQSGDESLPEAVSEYVDRQGRIDPASPYIDLARLMKAEWHFAKAENATGGPGSEYAQTHYGAAADAYAAVRAEKIDEKFHEIRLYKLGWSEVESGRLKDGIKSLSRFINGHFESDLASSALAKRAMAHQDLGDHPNALADYKTIVDAKPESAELEFAMQQAALIEAHMRQIPEMIASFRALLERFPETVNAAEARYWIGVGLFDQEKYEEAIPELTMAREDNPGQFGDKASLRLVLAHFHLEDLDALAEEARAYIEAAPEAAEEEGEKAAKRTTLPPQILEYLGQQLAEKGDHASAEFFLTARSTPDNPGQTSQSVWKLLAECRIETEKHHEAIAALDHYLVQTSRPSERASAYLQRGKAQFALRDFAAARESARESLRSQKEGRTNAEARLLMGDLAAAEGKQEEAAREYLVVSQIFMDKAITPLALTKAIAAFRALGDEEQAAPLQAQLEKDFPGYRAPAE